MRRPLHEIIREDPEALVLRRGGKNAFYPQAYDQAKDRMVDSRVPIVVMPDGTIDIQFCGWAIKLKPDGTWDVEDTTG